MESNEKHINVSVINVPDAVEPRDFHEWVLNEMNAVQQAFPGDRDAIFIRLYMPRPLCDAILPADMNRMFQGIVDVCPNILQIRVIQVEKSLTNEQLRGVLADIQELVTNEDTDSGGETPKTLH